MLKVSVIVLLLMLLSAEGRSAENPRAPKTSSETPQLSEKKISANDASATAKATAPKASNEHFSVGVKGQSQQAINELDRSHVDDERRERERDDRDELKLDEALDDWADDDGAELDDEHDEEANDEH